jgi:uncharacterized membrane protein YsdA (DUF1294 family)
VEIPKFSQMCGGTMNLKLLAVVFVVVNVAACIAMMLDKSYAIKNKWRLSETFLLSFSLLGGGSGLIFGMIFFKHKLSKMKFRVVAPLGICLYTAAVIYFIWIGKIIWV